MTDIFATLGPACADIAILKEMLGAGMTGLRLNLNHGRFSETVPLLLEVREAALFRGKELKILADLQGRSLRLGMFPSPVELKEGEEILLGGGGIPVPACLFGLEKTPDTFSLSDGRILLGTIERKANAYRCAVLRGGTLESRKGISVPGAENSLPVLTEQDKESIRCMKDAGVHAVMVPFAESPEQLISIRETLDREDCSHVKIWAKLENEAGLAHMEEWLPYADLCVIARGDLGNSFDLELIPGLQKKIARTCLACNTPFLIATGLLRSLMHEEQPSRADISDIYNAVLDGASGLMLTDETALGSRPVLSIRYLAGTAAVAERDPGMLRGA